MPRLTFEKPSTLTALQISRRHVSGLLEEMAPRAVPEDSRLYCVDANNSFSPYPFAQYARCHRFAERALLDRIFVTRTFTIHQLQAVAEEMLPPLLEMKPPPLLAVLGVEHLFLEETLPRQERRRILFAVAKALGRLRDEGMMVLATYDSPPRDVREWLGPLLDTSDSHRRFEPSPGPVNSAPSAPPKGVFHGPHAANL